MSNLIDQIGQLEDHANNLSALSQKWMNKGEDAQALTLSDQAVQLRNQVSILKAQNRTAALNSLAFAELAQHMDALNADAAKTEDQLQDVLGNVQTAETVIGAVSKLVALL